MCFIVLYFPETIGEKSEKYRQQYPASTRISTGFATDTNRSRGCTHFSLYAELYRKKPHKHPCLVTFEVFTAVTMKNVVFWDVEPYKYCLNRRFGWIYRLHLQGIKISHLLTLVPPSRIFLPWRWRRYIPPKYRFTQDLHGATSQKTAFFIRASIGTRTHDPNYGRWRYVFRASESMVTVIGSIFDYWT
jgi:hypothetical protein